MLISASPHVSQSDNLTVYLSLGIAALAVFVSPLVQLLIAKRQIEAQGKTARAQVISPMRQAWIERLRSILAELLSRSLHYFAAGFEERVDEEYRRLELLQVKLELMLNPNEPEHRQLMELGKRMVGLLGGNGSDRDFTSAYETVLALSQRILKAEWEVTKKGG